MVRWFLAVVAALLLLVGVTMGVLAIGASRQAQSFTAGSSAAVQDESTAGGKGNDESQWLTQYTLTERSGRTFHSRELAGKVHVVNFFFTACPTVCRMQTAAVQSLAREFGPQGVKFLSITCDPETDTPVALAMYADQFQADAEQWLFLTGELKYLRRVGAEVYFLPVDRGTHSESLLVLDRDGKIRGRFNWKQSQEVADMKALLAQLLAAPASTAETSPAK
jgi:cytochrome oxidase Cu insertion factor (SCO1/SenC/PrrC family)